MIKISRATNWELSLTVEAENISETLIFKLTQLVSREDLSP
jgi:hypothetical protein